MTESKTCDWRKSQSNSRAMLTLEPASASEGDSASEGESDSKGKHDSKGESD